MDIKKTIEESGLTIVDFAKSLYVTRQTVHNWLNGRKIPRTKMKQLIDKYGGRKLPTPQGETDID